MERVSKSGWLLVKGSLDVQPRQRRNQTKSHYCSWTVEFDENVKRKPRFLSKAVCTDCPRYCKPVYFDHRVLVKDCAATFRTHKERLDVWKWEKVTLPVAFVYNSKSL